MTSASGNAGASPRRQHGRVRTDPDTVIAVVARYGDELRRSGDAGKIADKVIEIG
jgi:hypothetical protein